MTDPIPDPTRSTLGDKLANVLGPPTEPTPDSLFAGNGAEQRSLLSDIRGAQNERGRGWVCTDLAGKPVNDDHTWHEVR